MEESLIGTIDGWLVKRGGTSHPLHRERFSRPGLPIGEDGAVVARNDAVHYAFGSLLPQHQLNMKES